MTIVWAVSGIVLLVVFIIFLPKGILGTLLDLIIRGTDPARHALDPARRRYTPCMAGCCPSRDYHRFFNQRFARRLANRYRKRGLDPTAQTMVQFLRELGLEGASVLEIGGGVGELEVGCANRKPARRWVTARPLTAGT